jgi:DNA polymerase-3 subunit beta
MKSGEKFILPSKAISVIDNMPDCIIDITADEEQVTVRTENIQNKYNTFKAEEFPLPSVIDNENKCVINNAVLMSIKKVLYAVATEHSKPAITAVYLKAEYGVLNVVGTNGFMLAWDRIDYNENIEMLIPKSTAEKIISLGLKDEISLCSDEKTAMFMTDSATVYTRLIEGEYLNYTSVFKDMPIQITASKKALSDAVTRVSMCDDNSVVIKLNGNKMIVSTPKISKVEYNEEIEIKSDFPQDFEISFNAKYIIETLKSFTSDYVNLKFKTFKSPMIVEDETEFKALILPLMPLG